MAKIEMPKEPDVDRLWTRDPEDASILEWNRGENGTWFYANRAGLSFDKLLRTYRAVYTTHPDLAALDKYPAPFSVSSAGTIRDATGKDVMTSTTQCPPCLTRFFMRAANFYAEHYAPNAAESEKR